MKHNFNFLMPLKGVATKTFDYDLESDEWILKQNYRSGKYFKGFEIPIQNLDEAYDILKTNQETAVFMIHGGIIEGTDTNNMIRRKRENPDGIKPTITDRNLNLFCLDIDGYDGNSLEDFINQHLPKEFHTADYIYQYSASYGLTTKKLNCHLFFWTDKAIHNLDLKEWVKAYNKVKGWGNTIDDSVLNAAQPVYIQRRICEGADDPVTDFLGIVKKEGPLNWAPIEIEKDDQTKIPIPKKSQYDLAAGVERILTSENYHNELNSLALSLLNKKVPPKTVRAMLEGAMNAARKGVTDPKRLEEWQVRFDDIGRSVDSAVDIVGNPTIEEILEWIETAPALEVKSEYANKVLNLSPMDRSTAIDALVEKIGFGIAVIKKTIKMAEEERAQEKAEAYRSAQKAERESRGIHELELTIENSGDIANDICRILANSKKDPNVFVMGGSLAHIGIGHPKTIRQCHQSNNLGEDYPKMPIIHIYKKPFASLCDRIKKDVMLVDPKGNDLDVPIRLLNVVGEGISPHFKPLTGIVENPFIDSNWKLVSKEGYNSKTGLYTTLHRKLKVKRINPKEAYDYLAYTVFDEFPFSSDLDRAVAVSALLTAVQRPSICGDTGFPGYGIVSPVQSSGKTTMAQLISYSVFNRPVAATSLAKDEVELGKHLLAILQEGHSCVLFDNIDQGKAVTSDGLSRAMSNDLFSGRQLGENKNVEVPASVLWIFTGNGIKFVGDFATRVYPININPKMENPNVRTFKRQDVGQWAMDNRKRIISAILSVIYGGRSAVFPDDIGSTRFREWDIFVRRPILAVSGIDINEAVKNNQMDDPIKVSKTNLLIQLQNTFDGNKFTTKEVIKKAYGSFEAGDTDLGDALNDLLGDKSKSTMLIGRYLGSMTDAVFGNLMLEKNNSNIVYWRIVTIKESGNESNKYCT